MYYLPYMEIKFATKDAELLLCRDAILELRPHISADEYLDKAKLLLSEGAQMVYVLDTDTAPAVSVFRMNYYFFRGKNIYIDDLSTIPSARGKGYAGKLLDFIIQYAKDNACANVHLDSGYGADRYSAHRLYLNKGFHLTSHHFVLDL